MGTGGRLVLRLHGAALHVDVGRHLNVLHGEGRGRRSGEQRRVVAIDTLGERGGLERGGLARREREEVLHRRGEASLGREDLGKLSDLMGNKSEALFGLRRLLKDCELLHEVEEGGGLRSDPVGGGHVVGLPQGGGLVQVGRAHVAEGCRGLERRRFAHEALEAVPELVAQVGELFGGGVRVEESEGLLPAREVGLGHI